MSVSSMIVLFGIQDGHRGKPTPIAVFPGDMSFRDMDIGEHYAKGWDAVIPVRVDVCNQRLMRAINPQLGADISPVMKLTPEGE